MCFVIRKNSLLILCLDSLFRTTLDFFADAMEYQKNQLHFV